MSKKYILIVLFFFGMYLYGQNHQLVDSLELRLKDANSIDDKSEIYVELIQEFQTFDLGKALGYAEKLKEMALRQNNDEILNKAYGHVYNVSILAGDIDKAEEAISDLEKLYQKINDPLIKSMIFQGKARFYLEKADYKNAIEIYQQAIEFIQQNITKDKAFESHLAHINLNYAITLMSWAYTKRSSGSLSTEEAENYKKKCLDKMTQALNYFLKVNEVSQATLTYSNLAVLYQIFADKDSILYYSEKTLQLAQDNNDLQKTAMAYASLADYHYSEANFGLALDYIAKSLKIYEEQGAEKHIGNALTQSAKVFLRLKQYDRALIDFKKSLEKFESVGYTHGIMSVEKMLSEVYELQGNYEKALFHFQNYSDKQKEVISEQSVKDIAWMRAKYDSENRERKITELQNIHLKKEKQIKNNWIVIILLISVLLISVLMLIVFRTKSLSQKKKHELEKQEMLTRLKEEELKSIIKILESKEKIKQKIAHELHDRLGVMLGTIKLYVETEKNKATHEASQNNLQKGVELLEISIEEVRAISRELSSPTLEKFGLNPAINELVKSINQTKRINIEYQYSSGIALDSKAQIHIYRIVQELLSNAIRHSKANRILLKLDTKQGAISLTYVDNGIGFSESQAKQGIGWKSIYSRINQLKGVVEFQAYPEGTSILFQFPDGHL